MLLLQLSCRRQHSGHLCQQRWPYQAPARACCGTPFTTNALLAPALPCPPPQHALPHREMVGQAWGPCAGDMAWHGMAAVTGPLRVGMARAHFGTALRLHARSLNRCPRLSLPPVSWRARRFGGLQGARPEHRLRWAGDGWWRGDRALPRVAKRMRCMSGWGECGLAQTASLALPPAPRPPCVQPCPAAGATLGRTAWKKKRPELDGAAT